MDNSAPGKEGKPVCGAACGKNTLAVFIVPLGLCYYPLLYLVTGIGLFASWFFYRVLWTQKIEFCGAWGILAVAAGIMPLFAGLHLLAWYNFFRVSELLWYAYFLGSALALGWLAGKRPRSRWYIPAAPAALAALFYSMPPAYDLFRVIRLPLPWERLPLICLAVGAGALALRLLVWSRMRRTERK